MIDACPSRDSVAGAPHVFDNDGICVFCEVRSGDLEPRCLDCDRHISDGHAFDCQYHHRHDEKEKA